MCSTDVYCSKQTGSSSTKGNHHPSFLRFWNWAEENCRWPKFVAAQENVVKTETQQTFVNGLLGFITLGIYTPLEAPCVLTIIMSCPSIWATLSTCSLIRWVPSSCFAWSASLWGWNNPVQRCLPVGGRLHYPRRRRWWLHATTDCFDVQPTTTSGNITQSIIFGSTSTNSACILHRAQQHHADASACQ